MFKLWSICMGTNTTISTKLAETAEMWQCVASYLAFIFGMSAFFSLLRAKTFPVLPNISTLSLITHIQTEIMFLHINTNMNVCAAVSLLPRGEISGLITSCHAHTSWDVCSHNQPQDACWAGQEKMYRATPRCDFIPLYECEKEQSWQTASMSTFSK